MLHGSTLPLLALYCLYRTLFPAENLSSLYLDSAVSPSGSQCNDLSLSVRTKESLYILHCRLKTQLIKRDVMSPTQFHFCHIFPLYLNLSLGEKSLLSFLFLNLASASTQLLSHTLLPEHRGLPDFDAYLLYCPSSPTHSFCIFLFFINSGGELICIPELAKINKIMAILSKHGAFSFQVNIKNSKINTEIQLVIHSVHLI